MNVSASERGFGIGGRDGRGWGLVGGAGARGCGCFPGETGGMLFVHRRGGRGVVSPGKRHRSEEHTSELQSLMRNSYAVFCLKKKIRTELLPGRTRTVIAAVKPRHTPGMAPRNAVEA